MYLHRHIEQTIKKAREQTKVVLLTGARQVGKSTSIQEVFPDYSYVTLDNENDLIMARDDRSQFFRDRSFPVIIDEVQYAKDLFREVKRIVDTDSAKGQVFLTGSQTYELMSATSESLSGRVSILEMPGLSMREKTGITFADPFLPSAGHIADRSKHIKAYDGLWEQIHRGSMPELLDPDRDWEWFYRDYVRTYLERDVRQVIRVQDEMKFRSFLVSIAARSGSIVVYEDIARDIGVDNKTVKAWVSVVAGSGLIKLLHPYQNNAIKRTIKSPKLYFLDTGLLCYLVGWKTVESARNGAMSGQIFETFVISEIMKSYLNAGRDLDDLYYYRDKDKREIDLLIKEDNTLYPVEIKKTATIGSDWPKDFPVLGRIKDVKIGSGAVICRIEERRALSDSVLALPIEFI